MKRSLALLTAGGSLAFALHVNAGFSSDNGDHAGLALTSSEKAGLGGAINLGLPGDANKECRQGLLDMLNNRQICKEIGPAKNFAAATTELDGKTTTGGDSINVSPGTLGGHPRILACIMAHEWVHATQTTGTAKEQEKEGYEAELNCLCSQPHPLEPEVFARKEFVERVLAVLNQPSPNAPGSIPATGIQVAYLSSGATLLMNQTSNFVFANGSNGLTSFTLGVDMPYSLVPLEAFGANGGDLIGVFGLDAGQGALQYIEVDPSTGDLLAGGPIIPLLGWTPFSATRESFGGVQVILFLDPVVDVVMALADLDGDQIPETLWPAPFATAAFPGVADALFIKGNPDDLELSIRLSDEDLRVSGGTPTKGTAFPTLTDHNFDGFADALVPSTAHDYFVVSPRFSVAPSFGDTSLSVYGTVGNTIEVWSTDAAGTPLALLGTVVIGTDQTADLPLTNPLNVGNYLSPIDITGSFRGPLVVEVSAAKNFGIGCETAQGNLPRGFLTGSQSIGQDSEWNLMVDQGPLSALLHLSLTREQTPMDASGAPGCTLYAWPPIMSLPATTGPAGDASLAVRIPNDPALVGLEIYGQWHVTDANANSLGTVFSNGLGIQVQP